MTYCFIWNQNTYQRQINSQRGILIFYILIQLFQKVVTNRESSSLDANFINTISLSITINPLVKDLAPILV